MLKLHLTRERAALAPRREPCWGAPLGKGRVLGFRKLDINTGSWIARMRDESNRKVYQNLALDTPQFGWDEARTAALKWFDGRDAGIADESITVAMPAMSMSRTAAKAAESRRRAGQQNPEQEARDPFSTALAATRLFCRLLASGCLPN